MSAKNRLVNREVTVIVLQDSGNKSRDIIVETIPVSFQAQFITLVVDESKLDGEGLDHWLVLAEKYFPGSVRIMSTYAMGRVSPGAWWPWRRRDVDDLHDARRPLEDSLVFVYRSCKQEEKGL